MKDSVDAADGSFAEKGSHRKPARGECQGRTPASQSSVGSRTCVRERPALVNRDLSWLDFNERVLAQAEDPGLPLLERLMFAAIFSTNLDEFFQVRVAGIQTLVDAGIAAIAPDGHTPANLLRNIRARVLELGARHEQVIESQLRPALAAAGIELVGISELGDPERKELSTWFEAEIFPALTPLCVDSAHPFPYISNLSLNLGVHVQDPSTGQERFARIKVPTLVSRFIPLRGGHTFLPIEELIAEHLELLLPGMQVLAHALFRVSLDGNLNVDTQAAEDAEDLLEAIESGLHRRHRMNDAVRLEVSANMSEALVTWLRTELELLPEEVYFSRTLLGAGAFWELVRLDRPDLRFPSWTPVTPRRLERGPNAREELDLFAAIRAGDLLVHHPYDSFGSSVEAFLTRAARDPHVIAIKATMYRTAGSDNPIAQALVRAAKAGKEVVALIELRARFDERPNIEWARSLEQAGVHVVFGVVGLKTHGKAALVVRREPDGLRRYCHLGTGNYNPATAKIYEDVGLFTAARDISADIGELFNYLTGVGRPQRFRKLLVAPLNLRARLLSLIREQTDEPGGQIVIKVNSLQDAEIVDALYEAGAAGVKIDLIVRGVCGIIPRVPGHSEQIQVRSVVGRFLEHSRIYRFGRDPATAQYFIGSADLLTRNLDRRVEILVPIEEPALRGRIDEILAINLDPDALCWTLDSSGAWHCRDGSLSTQTRFMDLAWTRAEL